MEILISMIFSFLIGFSAGVQRTKKKQKRLDDLQAMAENQQRLMDLQNSMQSVGVEDQEEQGPNLNTVMYSCTRANCKLRKNGVIHTSLK
ncbi:hypothetical protein [Faecalicoccus acidiformans]|uniref:Uncharacterized protein n=1 Tax=Faecalicoccus acidiformans TaxID=915173 RepID=A0ABS2FLU7_9FIRM|nr:hypothetical protein [Faecalicoccus acidiformans]MBM6831001.1 hypothetical protein [Faecalicoccus acidiformans]